MAEAGGGPLGDRAGLGHHVMAQFVAHDGGEHLAHHVVILDEHYGGEFIRSNYGSR